MFHQRCPSWRRTHAAAVTALLTLTGPGAVAAQTRPDALDRLDAYVGTWQAETSQTPDGREFHFGYALDWLDGQRTIVEMVITQHFADGETRTLWKGFKGWDRIAGGAYYYGFSPSGRVGRGEVTVEGQDLLTTYEGWGPNGTVVRIQDRFTPVDDGTFVSVTSIWRDDAWHEIMRDRWTETEGA